MKKLFYVAVAGIIMASCTTGKNYISDANAQLQLKRDDLEISKPVSAEVKQTLIFGIDFKRLTKADLGYIAQPQSASYKGGAIGGVTIPIVGSYVSPQSLVENYAIAKLMADNPGYDCVIYPKYMQKTKNILGFIVKTTGKLECRLGKIK